MSPESFNLLTSLHNGDDPFERVAQRALEPYPDALEFANWLITNRLSKERVIHFGIDALSHYTLDMRGIGDYLDDLCVNHKRWIYTQDATGAGEAVVSPSITGSHKHDSGLKKIVDGLYGEWKHLNKENAGVPSEF